MIKHPLVVLKTSESTTRQNTLLAATTVAIASLGDSFLYAYLPSNHQNIGISTLWVGILLSINRFIRLFFNGWIAFGLTQFGVRKSILLAAMLASICTISYGLFSSVLILLIARILWGVSFSALRLGSSIYAIQSPKKTGILLGINQSIIAIGPIAALLIGPLILDFTGPIFAFIILGTVSLAGVFAGHQLPELPLPKIERKLLRLSPPSSVNILILLNGFLVDGILVVLISTMVITSSHMSTPVVLSICGFYLAYKRISMVLFSPIAGWASDKWGFDSILRITSVAIMISFLMIISGYPIAGIMTAFTASAMNSIAGFGAAIKGSHSPLKEISDNTTWRDIGTATGTLVGSLFIGTNYVSYILVISCLILAIGLLWNYTLNHQKTILWK